MTKIRVCAYIYKEKKTVDVSLIDFEEGYIGWVDNEKKELKIFELETLPNNEIFLCFCNNHGTCKRRQDE